MKKFIFKDGKGEYGLNFKKVTKDSFYLISDTTKTDSNEVRITQTEELAGTAIQPGDNLTELTNDLDLSENLKSTDNSINIGVGSDIEVNTEGWSLSTFYLNKLTF